MIQTDNRQYYWLTDPKDAKLLYSLTKISPKTNTACYLCKPEMCKPKTRDQWKILNIIHNLADVGARCVKGVKSEDIIEMLLKSSQTMLRVPEICEKYGDFNKALCVCLQEADLMVCHYGEWDTRYIKGEITTYKTPIGFDAIKKELTKEYTRDPFERYGYKKYFHDTDDIEEGYLTTSGLLLSSGSLREGGEYKNNYPGLRYNRKEFSTLTTQEKSTSKKLPANTMLCFASDRLYATVNKNSELGKIMDRYLANPRNYDNIVSGSIYTDELNDLCKEAYYDYCYQTALKNKLLICDEETVVRDYGLIKLEINTYKNELEYRRTIQDINTDFYYMAQVLGIPEHSIGNARLALRVDKKDPTVKVNCSKYLAFFSPSQNKIHLNLYTGNGSFAHEWFHYLDYNLGSALTNDKYREYYSRLCEEAYNAGSPDQTKIGRLITDDLVKSDFIKFYKGYSLDEKEDKLRYFINSTTKYYKSQIERLARVGSNIVLLRLLDEGINNSYCCDPQDLYYSVNPSIDETRYIDPTIQYMLELSKDYGIL